MATDLTKYKRYNDNILEKASISNSSNHTKKVGRKPKGLKFKFTINFTEEEIAILKKLHEDTGIPIATIIRRELIKSGLLKIN